MRALVAALLLSLPLAALPAAASDDCSDYTKIGHEGACSYCEADVALGTEPSATYYCFSQVCVAGVWAYSVSWEDEETGGLTQQGVNSCSGLLQPTLDGASEQVGEAFDSVFDPTYAQACPLLNSQPVIHFVC